MSPRAYKRDTRCGGLRVYSFYQRYCVITVPQDLRFTSSNISILRFLIAISKLPFKGPHVKRYYRYGGKSPSTISLRCFSDFGVGLNHDYIKILVWNILDLYIHSVIIRSVLNLFVQKDPLKICRRF